MIKQNLKDGQYGVYFNYIDYSIQNWEELYFGQNYAKLQDIKLKYDPNGVFKRNDAGFEKKKEHTSEDL